MFSKCNILSMQDFIFLQSMENPRSQGYVVVQPKLHQGRYDFGFATCGLVENLCSKKLFNQQFSPPTSIFYLWLGEIYDTKCN